MRQVRLLLTVLIALVASCEDPASNFTANAIPDFSTNMPVAAAYSDGTSQLSAASGQSSRAASGDTQGAVAHHPKEVRLSNFCSDNSLPCIAYWDRLLTEYPDLIEKLRKVRDEQDEKSRRALDTNEQTEVRFYTNDSLTQSIAGSHIDIIVTDLNRGEIDSLIDFLEDVPEKAKLFGVSAAKKLNKENGPQPTIIVLGGKGSVSIKGSRGTQTQHIDLFIAEKQQEIEKIVVNTFGKRGESALNRLPKGFIKSGLGARPPPNAVRVVVIGSLREINIEGSSDKSTQVISFQKWANRANDTSITYEISRTITKSLKDEEAKKEKETEATSLIVPKVKFPEYKFTGPSRRGWPFASPPPPGWPRASENPIYEGGTERSTYPSHTDYVPPNPHIYPPPPTERPTYPSHTDYVPPNPHIYRPPPVEYRPPPIRVVPHPAR